MVEQMKTHGIDKLLAEIAAWKAADAAYREAVQAWLSCSNEDDDAMVAIKEEAKGTLINSTPLFVSRSTSDLIVSDHLLAVFTALADHCAQLTRERDALAARIERALGIEGRSYEDTDHDEYQYARGGNDMRDEFRTALAGAESEG